MKIIKEVEQVLFRVKNKNTPEIYREIRHYTTPRGKEFYMIWDQSNTHKTWFYHETFEDLIKYCKQDIKLEKETMLNVFQLVGKCGITQYMKNNLNWYIEILNKLNNSAITQ